MQLREMSGGRPLPASAPQTVGGIDLQLREMSGGHPLSVRAVDGGHPLLKSFHSLGTLQSDGYPLLTGSNSSHYSPVECMSESSRQAPNSPMTYSPTKQLFHAGSEGECFDFLV